MTDPRDQDGRPTQRPGDADVTPTPDQVRLDFALARADHHAVRERLCLELAMLAPGSDAARALELQAFEAFKDALAITQEHDLDE